MLLCQLKFFFHQALSIYKQNNHNNKNQNDTDLSALGVEHFIDFDLLNISAEAVQCQQTYEDTNAAGFKKQSLCLSF